MAAGVACRAGCAGLRTSGGVEIKLGQPMAGPRVLEAKEGLTSGTALAGPSSHACLLCGDRACLAAPPCRVQVRGASPHASQGAVLPLQPSSAALRPILHLRSRLPGVAASARAPLRVRRQSRTQPNASRPPSPCPPSNKLADCVQRHEPEPGGPWRRVQQRVELPRAARGWLAAQTTQQSSLGP